MLMPSIFGENLFDDFFNDFPFYNDRDMKKAERKLYGHRAKNLMKTDIKETDNGYEVTMNLPGVKKEDVKAELKDGYLTIQASSNTSKDEKDNDGRYIRRERYAGTCSRSFYVGDAVTPEDIKAKFENGTLTLDIPKKDAKPAVEQKKYISIE